MSINIHSADVDITYSDIDKLKRTTNVLNFVDDNLIQLNSYYQIYHAVTINNQPDLNPNIQIFKKQIINKLVNSLNIYHILETRYKIKHIKKSFVMLFDDLSKVYIKSLIDTTRLGLSYTLTDYIDPDIKNNKLSLSEMLFIYLESFNKSSAKTSN